MEGAERSTKRGPRVDIDRAIDEARKSGTLHLANTTLDELPEGIRELRELRELNIAGCGLEDLPAWLGELIWLERVDLARNPLTHIPPVLGLLPSLRQLGLSQTSVTEMSATLRDMSALERLCLAGTKVTQTPSWIDELWRLRVLDLGGNGVEHLTGGMASLRHLTHLYLWEHRFEEVPAVIRSLSRLEVLEISHGGSANQPDDADDYRLRPGNPADGFARLIGKGSAQQGPLSALPPWLWELSRLRILYAGGQRIGDDLPRLPPQLDELWLGENELETLPQSVLDQVRLRVLDLHGNRLSTLPPQLYRLQWIRYLDLRGNPLPLPPEVLASVRAPERIVDFAARIQGPTRRLDEAKLLVVGEGSVGKTSLIKRLVAGGFSASEQKTEGIAVQRWPLATAEGPIQLNIWDFGGQEIMHATHQFFLTKRSLYVLVIDARQGEEQNRLEYWLKLIQSFGGASPVVIVGNKTEQSVLDIDERGLRAKYPNVIDILSVSCKTGDGISDLKRRLAAAIEQMPHVRDRLPASYFAVKRHLERLDADFVTYSEYERLCERHRIDDRVARESLIEFLHDLGTVLCFRDDPRLSDTNILNPEWVTGGVYRLLNSHLAAQRKGLLRWEDVDSILDTAEYPSERRAFIVDVMKRFELCYESDGTFLVPDLLTKQEPDTGTWDGALSFEVRYDVLPSSVISRLIVRMHPAISKGTMWRTGLVVALDGNRALVKGDREDAVVRIAVDGPAAGRRGLLTAIRAELRSIARTIPGLAGEERVPVPGHPRVFVSYQHLLDLEQAHFEWVVPEGLTEPFPIRDLLAGVEAPETRLSSVSVPTGEPLTQAAGTASEARAWTPAESLRLGGTLVGAVVLLTAVFLIAYAIAGVAAGVALTGAAFLVVVAIALFVMRASGRLSEQGLLAGLRDTLAGMPHERDR